MLDTEKQHADTMAYAVWADLRSTHYGRAKLRPHGQDIHGHRSWRFPYEDRVYVAHRTPDKQQWQVSLWLAPWSQETGAPTVAASAEPIHGQPLLPEPQPRMRCAVMELVRQLYGTTCDHGYHRGRDSCPGCDVLDDIYDDWTTSTDKRSA